ncbi:phospholipid carrier-dependent glycosyltransferase [Candidatus Parcubacteria bacterium]|nr:phospholipid carrier-dependent glycosyltransferase [Candidatus Parcubacteria bacterium]
MKFLKENYLLLILLALVLLTRFLFLNYPAEVVFDEVHFGKFVSAYFTHQYYFDIHPPLGKLMIASFASLFNFDPGISFERIGEAASSQTLLILRFLPALFGALFVLVVYQIVIALGGSKKAAFLAGLLIVFDNAFLVESKFILVDSFLFFFGFTSILVYLLSAKQNNRLKKHLFYFLSMILAGLAFSIKWTGLSFLGIIFLLSFISFLKSISLKRLFKLLVEVIISLILFIFTYSLFFIPHFKLLTFSGPGDAFMSQDFQSTLIKDGREQKYLSFGSKLIELNQKMYSYNTGLTKGHTDSSKWYQWPLMRKPVWYWEKKDVNISANIYLMGNPLIWLSGLLAVFWGIYRLFKTKHQAYLVLLLGYFANLLPYVFVARAAFVYHYLPSLTFAIILLALWVSKRKKEFYLSYLITALLIFLMISPISYGAVLSEKMTVIYKSLAGLLH